MIVITLAYVNSTIPHDGDNVDPNDVDRLPHAAGHHHQHHHHHPVPNAAAGTDAQNRGNGAAAAAAAAATAAAAAVVGGGRGDGNSNGNINVGDGAARVENRDGARVKRRDLAGRRDVAGARRRARGHDLDLTHHKDTSKIVELSIQAEAAHTAPDADASSINSAVATAAATAGKTYTLRIRLRPDLSPSSTAAMVEAAQLGCTGSIYRNEANFLLQGVLDCFDKLKTTVEKGACPPGATKDPNRVCPAHDPECGCHGPIMLTGMVGWAGGSAGPDWFVYTGIPPMTWWGRDHTIIGNIADQASTDTLKEIATLPAAIGGGGMLMLKQKLQFTLRIVDRSNSNSNGNVQALNEF